MNLLNLGCGGQRPQSSKWINLDDLHRQLEPGTGAREQLNSESNYINHTIVPGQCLPFHANSFDGVLASHFFEHFDIQECRLILRELKRIMHPEAALAISVPDASYFRQHLHEDRNENWQRLFGVTDPRNPIPTFMEAALFFEEHKMLFTLDSLWCLLKQEGFRQEFFLIRDNDDIIVELASQLNRREFSIEVLAYNTK